MKIRFYIFAILITGLLLPLQTTANSPIAEAAPDKGEAHDTAVNPEKDTNMVDMQGIDKAIDDFNKNNPDHNDNSSFRGHWIGIDIGLNLLMTENYTTDIEEDFLSLRTGKSWHVNLNFPKYSIGIYKDQIGFITGLGIEWCNYRFENENTIKTDNNGILVERPLDTLGISKSKLTTSYLILPLLVEFQFPNRNRSDRMYISAGMIGGLKLGAHTKYTYYDDGDKMKRKNHEDFNLSPIRYGFTIRMGYKQASVHATSYMTPLFEKEEDPEVYPVNIGLTFAL